MTMRARCGHLELAQCRAYFSQMSRYSIVLGMLAALIPAGCAWLGADKPLETPVSPAAGTEITEHRLTLTDGPALDYRLYEPARQTGKALSTGAEGNDHNTTMPLVVLAHGFLRNQRNMSGLATALANAGYPVATLDSRHDSPISGGHVQNSQDMIALARHLKANRVIYAGFSAGALAALLAAHDDPRAIGVLTLDLVDSQELGLGVAPELKLPVVALAGAPTNCNANNNAAALYQAIDNLRLTPIPKASHCDFESPTDWLCRTVCEMPAERTHADPSVQLEIINAALAGVGQLARR
ncbi:putative dienelactone hydrolase [Thiorhodovibrio litoralis]|nr:hypothetical protein [Thiorhodovibrio winogradskyi]WPL11391.1 putative dienelactone hydrolase [Thiorhodovibrio litoralis]